MRTAFAFTFFFFADGTPMLAQNVPQPSAAAPSDTSSSTPRSPSTMFPTHHGVSPRLDQTKRGRPSIAPRNLQEPEEQEIENFHLPLPQKRGFAPGQTEPEKEVKSPPPLVAKIINKFDGIRQGINYKPFQQEIRAKYPPDANGSVGQKYYFQWVNDVFTIIDKRTGKMKVTPTNGNAIWNGLSDSADQPSLCKGHNDGDPIVIYDKFSKRWLVSQFAMDMTRGYYAQCVAISQTDDPGGEYYVWEYPFEKFNDYPKFGVWRDGYYATFQMYKWIGPEYNDTQFEGARVCAFEREKMLSGAEEPPWKCFDPKDESNEIAGGLLPADIDGTQLPLKGSPEYVVGFGDNSLRVWRIYMNWSNLDLSTISGPTVIPVATFEALTCRDIKGNVSYDCIPQKSIMERLDSLSDRMMYRLAYRNFDNTESLFATHTVKVGSASGIRWYELSRALSPTETTEFQVRQQQSFSPDKSYRWLGSVAADKRRNLLLAYNVSDTNSYPSLRFAGRRATDPLGLLSKEGVLAQGKRAIIGNRWGDYGSVSVDPDDDCTFWITGEYVSADHVPEGPSVSEVTEAPARKLKTTAAAPSSDSLKASDWDTIIARVKFPDCK